MEAARPLLREPSLCHAAKVTDPAGAGIESIIVHLSFATGQVV